MGNKELEAFLIGYDMSNVDFAKLVGVTLPAVHHWLKGRRPIPLTVVKLVRFFIRKPEMIREFAV